jgi:hypothetical protein
VSELLKSWLHSTPKAFLISIGVLLALWLLFHAIQTRAQGTSAAGASEASRIAMRPEEEAKRLASASNQSLVVVGNTIELIKNPNLTSLKPLNMIGWRPADVTFRVTEERRFQHILDAVGGINPALTPPNGPKFGVARVPFVTNDSDEMPVFSFYRTDYFTQRSVTLAIERNALLRSRFANLDPVTNAVPQTASLQALVLFHNDDLLCMWRDKKADSEGDTWSFTFEEQTREEDFDSPGVYPGSAEFLFRRALVEEVFGTRSTSISDIIAAWEKCEEYVIAHRLWGMFYEVATASFQFIGFYWLSALPKDLAAYQLQSKADGWLGTDPEGRFFVMSREEQMRLLETGSASVTGLHDSSDIRRVGGDSPLHRTSLYRLWRLSLAMNRRRPDSQLTTLNLDI